MYIGKKKKKKKKGNIFYFILYLIRIMLVIYNILIDDLYGLY